MRRGFHRRVMWVRFKRPNSPRGGVIIFFLVLSLVLIVMFFELHLRPQISEYAASEVKKNINLNINRIIGSEIADGNVTYEKLVTVQKDADNHITSISTNIDKMNALKVRVESSILENLMTEEKTTINIPLGSLIGGFFLSGRGPSFKVKVIPTTDVYASFDNSFVSAGINQTRHKIMMNFKVRIGMILSGRQNNTDVNVDICVAETVIVGETPQFFAGKQQ